jgi:hypothetical protein
MGGHGTGAIGDMGCHSGRTFNILNFTVSKYLKFYVDEFRRGYFQSCPPQVT